jgi:hypothetical protein
MFVGEFVELEFHFSLLSFTRCCTGYQYLDVNDSNTIDDPEGDTTISTMRCLDVEYHPIVTVWSRFESCA